jgi:hypothetical protein
MRYDFLVRILVDKSKNICGDFYHYSTDYTSLCFYLNGTYLCKVYQRVNNNKESRTYLRYTEEEIEIIKKLKP